MYSETLKSNMYLIYKCINSSEKQDQLENCERMILNFCEMNKDNDKMPYVKSALMGALALREMQLN